VAVKVPKYLVFTVEMALVAHQACIPTNWTHLRESTSLQTPINNVLVTALSLVLMLTLKVVPLLLLRELD
jgi:hypothetical protein